MVERLADQIACAARSQWLCPLASGASARWAQSAHQRPSSQTVQTGFRQISLKSCIHAARGKFLGRLREICGLAAAELSIYPIRIFCWPIRHFRCRGFFTDGMAGRKPGKYALLMPVQELPDKYLKSILSVI